MENMCFNCGFYKTPPLFWSGTAEPLVCNCPKENLDFYKQGFSDAIKLQTEISYSEKEIFEIVNDFCFDWNYNYKGELSQKEYLKEWIKNFKSKSNIKKEIEKKIVKQNLKKTRQASVYVTGKELEVLQFLKTQVNAPASRTKISKATEIPTHLLCRYMGRLEMKGLICKTQKEKCVFTNSSVFHFKAV